MNIFKILNTKKTIKISLILTIIMFILVMLIINPFIDNKNGLSIISLQVSFEIENGANIVNTWGELGITKFNSLIFADYIYALSYSFFFLRCYAC